MRPKLFLPFLTILILTSSDLRAGAVTWEFAGEVTAVRDDENLLGGQVDIGSPFSVVITFESTSGDSIPGPNFGSYNNSLLAFNGHVGSLSLTGPTGFNSISVRDGNDIVSSDGYSVGTNMLFGGHEGFTILELVDDDGTVFVNDFLPVQPPPLNQFESAEFLLLAADGKGSPITRIDGVVTSLVPEPATLSLLGLGVAYLLARRKRE